MPSNDVIRAAGVVLLRGEPREREVLLVHRPRRKDWSLPKGKVDPGEHVITAALRECVEETGYTPLLELPLPVLTYSVMGRPKQVHYWLASVRSHEQFTPNEEIDETRWVPLDAARKLLTYERDAKILAPATELSPSTPLIVLRHTQALKRSDYFGDVDALRPLTAKGHTQAGRLVSLLDAFGITSVHSSDATRCQQTVSQFAEALGVPVSHEPNLSEEGFANDPRRARKRMKQLAWKREPIVVCSHRPVLPTLMEAVGATLETEVGRTMWETKLAPGAFIVVHRVFRYARRPRIVAVERHDVSDVALAR